MISIDHVGAARRERAPARGISMKFAKFSVLAAGVAVLLSWFLPYATVRMGGVYVHVSAFQVIKGIDSTSEISNVDMGKEADAALSASTSADNTAKGAVALIFAPPLLLLALGGIAVKRKKLGRLGGTGAFLLGGWATAFGAALVSVTQDAGEAAGVGAGGYAYLAGGVLALVSGLLILIKPDRG